MREDGEGLGYASRGGVRVRLSGQQIYRTWSRNSPTSLGRNKVCLNAITTAAVAFAALLVAILSSGDVRELLLALIRGALSFG